MSRARSCARRSGSSLKKVRRATGAVGGEPVRSEDARRNNTKPVDQGEPAPRAPSRTSCHGGPICRIGQGSAHDIDGLSATKEGSTDCGKGRVGMPFTAKSWPIAAALLQFPGVKADGTVVQRG